MPRPTRINYTTEAFRELASNAVEELCDNAATLDIHDLRTWQRQLATTIARLNEHQGGGDVADLDEAAE